MQRILPTCQCDAYEGAPPPPHLILLYVQKNFLKKKIKYLVDEFYKKIACSISKMRWGAGGGGGNSMHPGNFKKEQICRMSAGKFGKTKIS
jgi:hypothetical protein